MYGPELDLYNEFDLIAGVDEVGRGCLFGDVYSACVVMPKFSSIEGVTDSKKLSAKKREVLYEKIISECLAFGIGVGTVKEIEELNIKKTAILAMMRAVEGLTAKSGATFLPDLVLSDYEKLEIPNIPSMSITHGDLISYNVACASIVAQVVRDRQCELWDREYPGYFIAKNKGYGTRFHREAIVEKGVSPLHREKFLRKIIGR